MDVKGLDSICLLELCAKDTGNHTAWQEFLARFLERIKFYISRSCKAVRRESSYLSCQISLIPAQEVDDLAQQVLLRLVEIDCLLLKRFRGKTEEEFLAYLADTAWSVARNHYRDLRRRRRPQIECSLASLAEARISRWLGEPTWPQHHDNGLEEALLRTERIAQFYAALRYQFSSTADSDKAILIFELHFRHGYTAEEISQFQGMNLSRRSVSRIIGTLKSGLELYAKAHRSKPST